MLAHLKKHTSALVFWQFMYFRNLNQSVAVFYSFINIKLAQMFLLLTANKLEHIDQLTTLYWQKCFAVLSPNEHGFGFAYLKQDYFLSTSLCAAQNVDYTAPLFPTTWSVGIVECWPRWSVSDCVLNSKIGIHFKIPYIQKAKKLADSAFQSQKFRRST